VLPTTTDPLAGVGPRDARHEYRRRRLDRWSDGRLVGAVGEVLAVPRREPADSFVLHAPLELLARTALLAHVHPAARDQARERLVWLAASYAAAGEPVDRPTALDARSTPELAADLVAALQGGDLDDVDRYAEALGGQASADELGQLLGDAVTTSLAAAAHGSILLNLLPRVAPEGVPGRIVRGPLRELARQPTWLLHWFEDPDDDVVGPSLANALLDVPAVGLPGSNFIYPVMHQAEESGLAAGLLSAVANGPIDVTAVRQQLSRVAAWSMLQEPPDQAPYGWSHCLTMPQAVMGLAGRGTTPRTATAVASTYVVGFRAALGQRHLVADQAPADAAGADWRNALDGGPGPAAAAVWQAAADEDADVVTELATRASLHHDAHLVKYTLACLDAAAADPGQRRLYLAAAASLSGWWAEHPGDGFFD
jgi:hypothetical protein